jgi:hypothetical protein
MTILEPLLGLSLPYSSLLAGLNLYCQSRRFKERIPELTENVQRFLDDTRKGWRKVGG